MYHRQVSSRPRSVPATSSSSDAVAPPTVSNRLSTAGFSGTPVSPAVKRVDGRADSTPPSTHTAGGVASPLSNTEPRGDDARAMTYGAHSSPGYDGSPERVAGIDVSRSPSRVPPPGL